MSVSALVNLVIAQLFVQVKIPTVVIKIYMQQFKLKTNFTTVQ